MAYIYRGFDIVRNAQGRFNIYENGTLASDTDWPRLADAQSFVDTIKRERRGK